MQVDRPIERRDVIEYNTHQFCAEASDLGWPPGKVPCSIPTTLGNRQPFLLRRTERREGEAVCWHYKQQFGCIELKVYND